MDYLDVSDFVTRAFKSGSLRALTEEVRDSKCMGFSSRGILHCGKGHLARNVGASRS